MQAVGNNQVVAPPLADVVYANTACALYAAFGQPQAIYAQAMSFGSGDGAQRKRPDAMTKLEWVAQHGLVRQALERELKLEDKAILLLRYGCADLENQRAFMRMVLSEVIQAELSHVSLQFLFLHVTVSWLGKTPKDDLNAWAEKIEVPYKTLARHRLSAKAMLDRLLDHAIGEASKILQERRWI